MMATHVLLYRAVFVKIRKADAVYNGPNCTVDTIYYIRLLFTPHMLRIRLSSCVKIRHLY